MIEDQQALYVAPENSVVSYTWTVEHGTILSGSHSDTVKVAWEIPGEGLVSAFAETTQGCRSDTTSLKMQIGPNGVQVLQSDQLNLYPVPVHNILQISSDFEFAEVEIVDLQGRSLLNSSSARDGLDLSALPSGVCLVLFNDKDGGLLTPSPDSVFYQSLN